jgi:SAM-dependent methyltransferase
MSIANSTERHRAQRLARAKAMQAAGGGHDFLLERASEELLERLSLIKRDFTDGLTVFARTESLAKAMAASGQVANVTRLESSTHAGKIDHTASAHDDLGLPTAAYDVILAPLALHFAADLPGALIQLRRALRPDGLFLAVLPGPQTLTELRECLLAAESEIAGGVAQRFDPLVALADAGALLQRTGFALPVADRDLVNIRYSRLSALIADLRGWGATRIAAANQPPLTRTVWERAQALYRERFSDADGKLRATIEFISLQGWVPHESQQKPLARGSAKISLVDALKPKDG